MIECLDQIENIWLKDKAFLANKEISVADIVAACEIEQPRELLDDFCISQDSKNDKLLIFLL